MHRSRRFIPSTSQLCAFEMVIRMGSTAAAGRELHLSQGTVSRLVGSLEKQLGRQLFVRRNRRLLPTGAALEYCRHVQDALDVIERASWDVSDDRRREVLSLAILPSFGSRWLAPRLGGFRSSNLDVTISLSTRKRPLAYLGEGFDAMICFACAEPVNGRCMKLFDENLTACAAPGMFAGRPPLRLEDLHGRHLFRMETRPDDWKAWFVGQGAVTPVVTGMMFDQFGPMIESAIAGLGVALLPHYLASAEIGQGRLVPLLRQRVTGTGAYWLVWPADREAHKPFIAFRRWLADEIAEYAAAAGPTLATAE